MSALYGVDQIGDGVVLLVVFAVLIALAVACAPSASSDRLPALAKRPRDTGRY